MTVNVRPNRAPIDYLTSLSDGRKVPSSLVTCLFQPPWGRKFLGAPMEAPMVAKAGNNTACPVSCGRGPAYKSIKYDRNACTMDVNVRPNRAPIDYLSSFSDSRKVPSSRVTCLK